LSEEFEDIRREAQKLLPEDRDSCMMPKVEEEVLETIVSNTVKGVVDLISELLTQLSLKMEELNEREASVQKSRPKILSAFPMRPLVLFSRGFGESLTCFYEKFCQNLILQGVSLEDNDFCIAYLESYLSGAALAYFKATKAKQNCPKTFKEWAEKLKWAFPDGRDSDVHQMMVFDRKQKITETVGEYAEDLKHLANIAYPELDSKARDNIIRPIFLRNIKAKIREPMKFREFSSLADAIKAASFIEAQLFREEFNLNNSSNLIGVNMAAGQHNEFKKFNENNLSKLTGANMAPGRDELKNLLRSVLREERERRVKKCFRCGSTTHLIRNCRLRYVEPHQLIQQARVNGQPQQGRNRFQPYRPNDILGFRHQLQPRNMAPENRRDVGEQNNQGRYRTPTPHPGKGTFKTHINKANNRSRNNSSHQIVNTLQCGNANNNIEYMADDENLVACISGEQLLQMQLQEEVMVMDASDALEQRIPANQVLVEAQNEATNGHPISNKNRHYFTMNRTRSLPNLGKLNSVNEFFPGLIAVKPISPPVQPDSEEENNDTLDETEDEDAESKIEKDSDGDFEDNTESILTDEDYDHRPESRGFGSQMEVEVEVELPSENEDECVIIDEYPASSAIMKLEWIQNRIESINATPERKKALKRQKQALMRQIDQRSNTFSEIVEFLTLGVLFLSLSLCLPFLKKGYDKDNFKCSKRNKSWKTRLRPSAAAQEVV